MTSVDKIKLKNGINILLGLFITAASFNLLFLPNDLVVYDSSGLAIIVEHFFKIDPSIIIFLFLVGCLISGFIFLGFRDTKNAILGTIAYPVFVKLTENIGDIITINNPDMLVIAIFAGITTGFGNGLIFKSGYNTGGTDILELILCKYLKMPFSKAMLMVDGTIVLVGGFVFGYELLFYAILALVLIALVSDKITLGINENKAFYIITKRKNLVERFLIEGLKKEITVFEAESEFKNDIDSVIYTVVETSDYYRVKEGILKIDPGAFITIVDTTEMLGGKKNKKLSSKK